MRADDALDGLRSALGMDQVRFEPTFGITSSGAITGLRIEYKGYADKSWKRAMTVFAAEDQTISELFGALMDIRKEEGR